METRTRVFQGENMVDIKEVLNDIKRYAKEVKKKNGFSKLPANKDMNLWMIKWMLEQDRRLTKVETRQSMMFWFMGILFTFCAFLVKLNI